LNGNGQLSAATRDVVRSKAAELRFRPNEMARSLSSRSRFTIGLVSTDRHGRFSIPVLEGIEDTLDAAEISVFLCNAAGDPERERKLVASLLAMQVDGIIVTGKRSRPRPPLDLEGETIPVVYAFARVSQPDSPCLLPDDHGGGRLAGEHLLRLGRCRIAHVTGPMRTEAVRDRAHGLQAALEAAGYAVHPDLLLSGYWSEAWGHEVVARLIASGQPIDAIFCGSDQIARGVVDALRDRGIRVPEDIAVVGFDNWEIIAAATRPALTTIDMDLHELGRRAGLRLLAMIDGRGTPGVVRLPCRLIVRDSCGGNLHMHEDAPDLH
jgi:LacI family transcriptional regulator